MEEKLSSQYLAGLFDGEGCVRIGKYKKHGFKNYRFELKVYITNTDKSLLDLLQKQFNGSILKKQCKYKNRTQCYNWSISNKSAANFLETIYPYSISKKKQIEIALEFQRKMIQHKTFKTEDERIQHFEKNNSLYQKLAELKGFASSVFRQQRLNEITPKFGEAIVQSA